MAQNQTKTWDMGCTDRQMSEDLFDGGTVIEVYLAVCSL